MNNNKISIIKNNIVELLSTSFSKSLTYSIYFLYHAFNILSFSIFILALFTYASIGIIVIALLYLGAMFSQLSEVLKNE